MKSKKIPSDKNPSEIEAEYRETVKNILPQIEAKLSQGSKLIDEACKLADKHGIPFYGTSNNATDTYIPENLPALDEDLIEEIAGTHPSGEYGYPGWQTSYC